jgi:hypothetical protein
VLGVAPAALAGSNTRYARALVQVGAGPELMTGRSRPIPNAGGTFDLTPEAVPWVFELSLDPTESVLIRVHIAQDLGDAGPPAPVVVTGSIADPWKSGITTLGTLPAPQVRVRVTTTYINPTDAAFVARASAASGVSATLTAPQGFIVQFTDILGLYKPIPAAPPPALGSAHVAGYASGDNLGRVFTNRLPNGTWKRDTQFIEVQAKIIAFGGPTIPAAAKIQWTISDPDDPTNEFSHFHREWGPYVDPNDYGPAPAFAPLGAHAGDNVAAFSPGNADEAKLFGVGVSGTARWHAATGGPAPSPASSSQAKSPLTLVDPKTAKTSVRIHCPNVLGTNMTIKAELIGTPAGIPVHNATTGVITMWSRIDVEVKRMSGAFTLAGALQHIPPFFLPACVQMDFQAEALVPAPLNQIPIAATRALEDTKSTAWVNAAFTNKAKGGWFFLGAAGIASPLPGGASSPPPLFDGTSYTLGTTGSDAWVEVPGALAHPAYLEFSWTDGAGNQQSAGFGVESSSVVGANTRMVLDGNDLTPLFTGHDSDGSIEHAYLSYREYFPQHEKHSSGGPLVSGTGGFGVPSAGANVTVFRPGHVFTSGISPSLSTGGKDFFAGRTVIFTTVPNKAASFLPRPDKPVVSRTAGTGAFAAGRDVYIGFSLINGHGESAISHIFAFTGVGTSAGDRFSVPSPPLSPWHLALAGANAVTGYNVYEADVPTGSAPPHLSDLKKVNAASVPIGTSTPVNTTGTGSAPLTTSTAAITPAIPIDGFDDAIVATVTHEFTHAFGMPHKCGNWNWRTPRQHSCSMNYFDTWLDDPTAGFKLLPNTVGKKSNDLCGRHLMEVRRVHLERNKALKALGW